MSTNDAFIKINDVSKHFGQVVAVDNIAITIKRGEFFSLLGASGCGKTTLLRMLAGFESPTSGEIYIDDAPMSEMPPHHRPTNMVFQNYAIFPHLDVRSNIAFGLRADRLGKAEAKQRVAEVLELVKLHGFGDRRSTELSGSQRQRVALARALIKRPKVLLLDEPLGALDKKLREEMQIELRALQQSLGTTFVFVTHDQEEAMSLSDRIAVMSKGRVLQIGSPKVLYDRPASVEVADFIGQMNFLEAQVFDVRDGQVMLDAAGLGKVSIPASAAIDQKGMKIIVAIRPEKLTISAKRPNNDRSAVQGVLKAAAYLGGRSHYHLSLDGTDKLIAVEAQEMDTALSEYLEPGAVVWLSWADDALIVLPHD